MLKAQASRDPLTGLVTRRVLDEAMHQALMPLVPRQGGDARGTALVLLDLDHFKAINDTYGHPVGDDALVHLAALLRHDAGPDVVVARLGGDEMAVLLTRCTAHTAQEWARTLLARVLSHPLPMSTGADLTLGISVGVGHSDPGPMPLRDLYSAADASLYAAKHAGRGQVGPTRTASLNPPPEAATPTPLLVHKPPPSRP
nr:GGDEF domain-containing protein [Kineosporia mesophila]